jgi:hypothetical protein
MRKLPAMACALALFGAAALAQEEWAPLLGDGIRTALEGRSLTFENGAVQTFDADGTTTYMTTERSEGRWRVEGDQYCSLWPPGGRWACYGVSKSSDGAIIRFTAGDSSMSDGRYSDQ